MELLAEPSTGCSCGNGRPDSVAEQVSGAGIWVGVDVGKSAQRACAVGRTGKVVFSRKVGDDQREVEALLARAEKAAAKIGGPLWWALGVTDGPAMLLVAVPAAVRLPVVYVPGRKVNRMAGAFAGEAKTDARGARTIAETARPRTELCSDIGADPLVGELWVLAARM